MPIRMYNTVQTGPNKKLGGVKVGFASWAYQMRLRPRTARPEREPSPRQIAMLSPKTLAPGIGYFMTNSPNV